MSNLSDLFPFILLKSINQDGYMGEPYIAIIDALNICRFSQNNPTPEDYEDYEKLINAINQVQAKYAIKQE